MLEDKTKGLNLFSRNKQNSSRADFNCPGGGVMMLDGKMYSDEDQKKPDGDVHLSKVDKSSFKDEWDDVIENYTIGANDPDMIDSVSQAVQKPVTIEKPAETINEEKTKTISNPIIKNEEPVKKEIIVYLLLSRKIRWNQILLHQLLNKSLQAEKRSSPRKFL